MDAITGMDQMDPESVDLVVTSPPYDQLRTYNDSSGWNFETFTKIADGLIKVLKPGGVISWNVADAIVEANGGNLNSDIEEQNAEKNDEQLDESDNENVVENNETQE